MTDPIRPVPRYIAAVDQANAILQAEPEKYTPAVLVHTIGELMLLEPKDVDALWNWLSHHERDIADPGDWQDYAILQGVFRAVVGREASAGDAITEREREIAKAVCNGLSNREIAIGLGISHGTVRIHLSNIYRKTGCANRTQLAMHLVGMTSGILSKVIP